MNEQPGLILGEYSFNHLVARRFHRIDWLCVMALHMCLNRWA